MTAKSPEHTPVTVIGLGAMGRALAAAFVAGGHPTTVWNRTPGKAKELVAQGALEAADLTAAIEASPLIVVCVFDEAAVRELLTPVGSSLAGRTVAMLTTFTPKSAVETSAWLAEQQAGYLGGAVMAVPDMIGTPGSQLFYSGPKDLFDTYHKPLELLGVSRHVGEDPGTSALYETALLSGMYAMFAGFQHGAALIGTGGVSATEFAGYAVPFVQAMATMLPLDAEFIDKGDYTTDVQSLEFNRSALEHIVHVSQDQGIGTDVPGLIMELMDRQIRAGHGADSATRMFESIKHPQG
ncbi:NAD(P)-dependent oxidoreductase [Streptomyces zagrosensis]|uniref:3-hydroxyisobutyrate dehydrogenase-like beta-hydroxyacid dehydrogenase n=1 Tax=Streptomyces zagrosensis TaxID=1042984 RepID=A0A7W9Q5K8_9ACTN|nr:NAD(P)-binding domain-containing protein [Streptomyces zagrosensis]MBB5934016.1 3-hydroxyisobutyrate dehydrogenase-like beta-hydroxyacid dehydrogenase [Streptomyces zagrosensis]